MTIWVYAPGKHKTRCKGKSRIVAIGLATLARAGLHPLWVQAAGATAVAEDVGPAGTYGVVTMPGIALSLNRGN